MTTRERVMTVLLGVTGIVAAGAIALAANAISGREIGLSAQPVSLAAKAPEPTPARSVEDRNDDHGGRTSGSDAGGASGSSGSGFDDSGPSSSSGPGGGGSDDHGGQRTDSGSSGSSGSSGTSGPSGGDDHGGISGGGGSGSDDQP